MRDCPDAGTLWHGESGGHERRRNTGGAPPGWFRGACRVPPVAPWAHEQGDRGGTRSPGPPAHPRAALAEKLWSELPRSDGRDRLRRPLWRLKQRGIVALTSYGATSAPLVRVDVEYLYERARQLVEEAGDELSTDIFTEVLLPAWPQDWIVTERERVHQTAVHALESIAARLLSTDRPKEAAHAAQRAVDADPARQSAARLLAAATYRLHAAMTEP